jgi:uncharacterized OB-fold protein
MGPLPPVLLGDRWQPGPPPVLLGSRCRACAGLSFPPRPQCPGCWGPTLTTELPATGTLYTFTTVHVGGAPYPLGQADLGGIRVLGPLTGAEPWIGAPVTVTETATGPPGSPSRVYAFRVSGR